MWKSEYKTQYTQNSITPLVVKDRLISSGYKQPLVAYARTAAVIDEAWVNKDVNLYMSTPVASKGKLICFSQRNRGQLCQVDAQTGETDWLGPPRQGDNGALIAGQDFVFCQNTNGELIVISPNSDTYKELARYKISNSPTWAHPAIVGSTLLIKNLDTLSAIQLH